MAVRKKRGWGRSEEPGVRRTRRRCWWRRGGEEK